MNRFIAFLLLGALQAPALLWAEQPAKGKLDIADVTDAKGLLMLRPRPSEPWQPIKVGAAVPAEALLVALPDAVLLAKNGAVQLKMLADIGKRGPFPVIETAIVLHTADKADLDFTLDRGIVGLENKKKAGAATVRLRAAGQTWELVLNEPGSRMGMEIYGRHAPGQPKFLEPDSKTKDDPTLDLVLLVVQGSVTIKTKDQEVMLSPPPGPARITWDNVDHKMNVQRLEKLPPYVTEKLPDEAVKRYEEICKKVKVVYQQGIDKTLEQWLASDDPVERRMAVVGMGALDQLPQLLQCLYDEKHADVRDQAIPVLRHWLGRKPGQAETLYEYLVKRMQIPPARAKSALHLLFGFTDEERHDPATYSFLLECLSHKALPVREIAHWHLERLAPAGKSIAYDAAAPPEVRERAVAQWRALIPEGKLPEIPKPKAPDGK